MINSRTPPIITGKYSHNSKMEFTYFMPTNPTGPKITLSPGTALTPADLNLFFSKPINFRSSNINSRYTATDN